MPLDQFDNAVRKLLVSVNAKVYSLEETYARAKAVVDAGRTVDGAARDDALQRMDPAIATAEIRRASLIASAAGALVEDGADSLIALNAVLARLKDTLPAALAFEEACRATAEADGKDIGENDDSYIEMYAPGVSAARPELGYAWGALDLLCPPALAMLSRSISGRQAARADGLLMERIARLAPLHGGAGWLATLLGVLDDEELLALHPALGRGYRVRVSGVADNFQLHTLLADALIGNPDAGWLPGAPPDPRVAAAARDREVDPAAETATGAFTLVGWPGLRPDGTLEDEQEHGSHWIGGEGAPRDIPAFEGTRVVLLGAVPYGRGWNAGRQFPTMPAELGVVEVLDAATVQQWLQRIAAAPR